MRERGEYGTRAWPSRPAGGPPDGGEVKAPVGLPLIGTIPLWWRRIHAVAQLRTTRRPGALVGLVAGPAFAGKPDHAGKGNGNGAGKGKSGSSAKGGGGPDHGGSHDDGPDVVISFSSGQRSSYTYWYHDHYDGGCPPGLAKKHNGCMPRGWRRSVTRSDTRYRHGIECDPLPSALAILLGAPPVGYRYGILDGDVVKLAIGTALVVDAIEGLAN